MSTISLDALRIDFWRPIPPPQITLSAKTKTLRGGFHDLVGHGHGSQRHTTETYETMHLTQDPQYAISDLLLFLRSLVETFNNTSGARLSHPPPQFCEKRYGGPLVSATPVMRSMQEEQDEMSTLTT